MVIVVGSGVIRSLSVTRLEVLVAHHPDPARDVRIARRRLAGPEDAAKSHSVRRRRVVLARIRVHNGRTSSRRRDAARSASWLW